MNICKKLSLFALSLILCGQSVPAQVSITALGPGSPYTQDFTALGTGALILDDNVTILGVYAGNPGGDFFFADNGGDSVSEYKNYGPTGDPDRALGSLADAFDGTGDRFYGIRFQNDTGVPITSIEVQYVGEQWRSEGFAQQTLAFSYRQDAGDITDLTSGTYTAVSTLDFLTPTNNGAGAIDGNLAANRELIVDGFAVTILPGEEIMLRWTDFGDAGARQGVAIDDVVVIARSGTTAADATISGRVVTAGGRGISGARLVLTGGELAEPVYALSNTFGYYSFTGIPSGHLYAVTVNSKRYRFLNGTRTVDLSDNVADVDFVAQP